MDEYTRRADAEKLLFERLEETALNNTGYQCDAGDVYIDAADRVRRYWLPEIPAADVWPVVRGKWTMHSDYPDRLICSECGAQFDVWHWESKQMHFCPNCGADMMEES